MNWFYDMKIGKKLTAAVILVGAITAVIGFIGVQATGKIADMAASSYANEALGIVYLKQADVEIIHEARAEKNFLLSSDAGQREKYGSALAVFTAKVKENL